MKNIFNPHQPSPLKRGRIKEGVANQPTTYNLQPNTCILGIDPGLERTGWAIMENDSRKPRLTGCGLIKTSAKLKMETRLLELNRQLLAILKKYKPAKIIIEELFFSTNVKTAIMVGQARGVILLSLAQSGAPIINVTPTALKSAVAGSGTASKIQIQKMLPLLCEMNKPIIQDDTADAIALAWYGCK